MPKTHKLEEKEQKHLLTVGNIVGALNSWANTLEYLIGLVEKDRQNYVDKNVRSRFNLKSREDGKADIHIDAERGIIEEIE